MDSSFYLVNKKWIDFILTTNKNSVDPAFGKDNSSDQLKINPISIEEMLNTKLRLALLLFLRDIANKLSSDKKFKLQLKLIFTFTTEYIDLEINNTLFGRFYIILKYIKLFLLNLIPTLFLF